MVRERTPEALDPWLTACSTSEIRDLQTFASGIQRDYASVMAALATPWSNGQVEGQINRLEFLKRQRYGRASFDLLRQCVLHAA